MGIVETFGPSFIEGSHHTSHVGNTLSAVAKQMPKPAPEVCTLIPGMFGVGIQLALCAISVMMLLVKYYFESPKRTRKVFLMDFVQLMCGSSTVHLLNIISSILINKIKVNSNDSFVQDECNMYFMTTVFDATIGVYIEYKIVKYLAIKKAAYNYLQKHRKSMFTPTVQELADAKLFATRSINSMGYNLLGPTSSISTTASLYNANYVSAEEKAVSKPGFFSYFTYFKPKLSETVENPMMDNEFKTLRSNSFVEVVDLEALHSHRLNSDRRDPLSEKRDGRPLESELHHDQVRGDSESKSVIRDQFTNELDDTTTVDEEDELLTDDELPNASYYSNPLLYNVNSLYSKFNKWSRKRANKEFLLNLYTWLLIVSGLKCVSIILFTIFSYQINLVTSYILYPFSGSHKIKLIIVMIVFPLFLNVFQYYVTDSIIKIKIPLN
ncbi:hypothetical protein MACJ_001527 [Theileria orientalis]|uniref:Uncharacterized protein n=1 Tax=Theileria orientalis TaxID=68886 RepID=A0A976MB09_THEOR|nr:hypothetical protein MACJ_001527 [Theileria orientalis]